MSIGTLFFGNGTFVDVLRGYVSMEQFLKGDAFNTLNYDLGAEKVSYFVAWWTPGQYVLPYLFKLIGLPLWLSQGIWIVFFTGISLLGYFRLFQHFGFTKNKSLLSVLIIQTNQLFFWNTLLYFGGSLFELGLLPWFVLFVLKLKSSFNWKEAAKYAGLAIVLFFFKATFLIHVGIGLAVLLVGYKKRSIQDLGLIFITGIVVLAVCYFGFLQFGDTPGATHEWGNYDSIPNSFWMDWMIPFTSLFGVFTNIATVVLKYFSHEKESFYIALILFPILTFLGIWLLKRVYTISEDAKKLVVYTLLFFACFLYFYLTEKAVSYDLRHFAPLVFCFVPFGLDLVQKIVRKHSIFAVVLNLLLLFNLALFAVQRLDFWFDMSEHQGLFYTRDEKLTIDNLNQVFKKSPQNSVLLLEDNWFVLPAISDREIIPIYASNGTWYLKSGIEINHPKRFDFHCLDTFDNLILLDNGKQDLKMKLKKWTFSPARMSRSYEIFTGKRSF